MKKYIFILVIIMALTSLFVGCTAEEFPMFNLDDDNVNDTVDENAWKYKAGTYTGTSDMITHTITFNELGDGKKIYEKDNGNSFIKTTILISIVDPADLKSTKEAVTFKDTSNPSFTFDLTVVSENSLSISDAGKTIILTK